jgi:hypothetical protein
VLCCALLAVLHAGVRDDDEQHQSQCQLHHSAPGPDGGAAVGAVVLHKRDTNYMGGAVQAGGHTHQPAVPRSGCSRGNISTGGCGSCGLTQRYMACLSLAICVYTDTIMLHVL